jgi:hypothetical protein
MGMDNRLLWTILIFFLSCRTEPLLADTSNVPRSNNGSGNDGNAGTTFRRFLTDDPQKAVSLLEKALPGDTIVLKNGIYQNAVLRFHAPASTPEKPVVFMAEKNGEVFLEGNSFLAFSGEGVQVIGFYFRNGGRNLPTSHVVAFRTSKGMANRSVLSYCTIDNYNDANIGEGENKWVSLYGQYNTVSHCIFKRKVNRGTTLVVWLENNKPAHHLITQNQFLERRNDGKFDNGLESIRIGDSQTSFTDAFCEVSYNLFEKCDGEIEIISNKSGRNFYHHNRFLNNDGGLTLRHGNHCRVENNYFDGQFKSGSYGVRVIGEGHEVRNNIFTRLQGGTNVFRTPLNVVNGIENSPLNGYFQVKNAVAEHNVFWLNEAPSIRIGAGSRAEAVLPPLRFSLVKNIVFQEQWSMQVGNQTYEILHERTSPIAPQYLENKALVFQWPSGVEIPSARIQKRAALPSGFQSLKLNGNDLDVPLESFDFLLEKSKAQAISAQQWEESLLLLLKKIN